MSKTEWEKILGFVPSLELKRLILKTVKTEGISLLEAAGRYALPPLLIEDEEPDLSYDNPFRPPIIIKQNE